MFAASFPESNNVLGKPHTWDGGDECEALCTFHGETAAGTPLVVSCWKVTAEELAEINRTGRVWLTVVGQSMPPVAVDGLSPFSKEPA